MRRISRSTLALAAAALAAVPSIGRAQARPARAEAPAQGAAQSVPITDVHYDVTFDAASAGQRIIKVAMSFSVASPGTVLLSLPAWTPGAYEISNFARWVMNFRATSGERVLPWDKLDYDTWRIRAGDAKSVKVSFDYKADTLDNAMAWSRPDFAFFNGTNLFLYAEGRPLEFPATVTMHTDAGWQVVTSMPAGAAPRTYTATNYHDLVDMPFFVGKFDLDSTRIAERWVRLATYPAGVFKGAERTQFWNEQKRIIPTEAAVFQDTPFPVYTIMQVFDSASQGGSALEHQSSHLGIYTPLIIGNPLLQSITAHEQFHAWNVKRLRPADMWPYDYSRPMPTPWLWVSEGITDYYADLALVRSGVVNAETFYRLTGGKMDETGQSPPVALTDASLSTWIHPVDGSQYIYYPKGSLAGFMLDVMIRDASDNKHSLDDVMRELYQTAYKQGKGFTAEQWWGAVSRAAGGKSFDSVYARYIDGREPFPWETVLPLAGLRVRADTAREPRLGVFTEQDSAGVRVTELEEQGAASAAGIKVGDYIVSIGDIPVNDATFALKFRDRYAKNPQGTQIPVRIRRGTQTQTVSVGLRFTERIERELTADAKASPKALRVREGIVKGTTG